MRRNRRLRHRLRSSGRWLLLLTGLTMASAAVGADSACPDAPYVFSWSMQDNCGVTPRGGTSTGTPVTLDRNPGDAWQALQAQDLTKFERDRRAILAMAGDYRVSFEFIETIGYTPDYKRPAPYHSWATERIHVIADEGDFISLQHVMVMYYLGGDADGGKQTVQGPVVMKHWREDWHYQDRNLFVFRGNGEWTQQNLPENAATGRWTQAVYQVDDAPRYEASGRWHHAGNHSVWESAPTWRPVPRREASVRDDYDVLVGVNRITILPTGWVHGQDNEKLVLDESGKPQTTLAREQGVNRYQRIVDFDFAAGDRYWQRTAPFWSQVRAYWTALETAPGTVHIDKAVDGTPHYAPLFDRAAQIAEGEAYDAEAQDAFIDRILSPYMLKRQ